MRAQAGKGPGEGRRRSPPVAGHFPCRSPGERGAKDDEATRALMVEFYRQYLGGKSKPEALRLARTAVRTNPQHPEWAHPYYWAAFVLFGDWM